jgi:hypothetical protein
MSCEFGQSKFRAPRQAAKMSFAKKSTTSATQEPAEASANGWYVRVGEADYGPYTVQQMAGFVLERRVKAHTLVRSPTAEGFTPAGRVTDLLSAFAGLNQTAPNAPEPKPARPALEAEVQAHRASVADDPAAPANLVISADIRSGEVMAFEAALAACGPFVRASEYVWVLRARMNASALRKALSRPLKVGDKLLIVDATRDRLSWFNIGPQNDVALRQLWDSDLPD